MFGFLTFFFWMKKKKKKKQKKEKNKKTDFYSVNQMKGNQFRIGS